MPIEKEKVYQVKDQIGQNGDIKISPEFLRRLQIISKVVGGDFGMKVEIGKSGEGSFFNNMEGKIILDPLHIKENPEFAIFVSAHEGGHRAISRGPHEIGLKDEKINEISSELGFAFGSNCCEDPADNNWIEKKFEGLKENVKNTYDKMLEKENIPLGMDHPEVRQTAVVLGYIPKFVYFGSEIVRYWHQGRFSKGLDEEILKGLEKTKNNFQEYFESTPSAQKTEKETIEKARERFLNFYQNIWPEMKKIVEIDINDEKLRQMAKEMMDNILRGLDRKLKKELEESLKQGQKGFEQETDRVQKELEQVKKQGERLEKEIEGLKEKIKGAQDEEKKNLEKELKEKEAEMEQNKDKGQKLKDELETTKKLKENEMPLPIDKISQKLKDKLQEIFESLSEEKKKELEEKTKERLKKLEDKLNREIEGKLNLDNIESHQEQKDRLEKEKQEMERVKKEQEELEKTRKETQKKIEKGMNEYDRYYQQVKPIIEELYDELKKVFLPQRHPRWKGGYSSGSRLDLLRAMQFEADKAKYKEIWGRKTIPQKIDYRFKLLVDMSSSMHEDNNAQKIKETFKGVIIFSETLNRLGIKFAVNGFTTSFSNNTKTYKSFKDDLSKEIRNKMSGILSEGKENTPTASATELSSQELEANQGKDNFLITLTDGQPYTREGDEEERTKEVIKKICSNTKQKLIGLGLGPNTKFVEKFYPAAKGNINIEQLPKFLSQLLEDMIKNPAKY